MRTPRSLLFLLALTAPALLSAQTPVGREIEVGAATFSVGGADVAMDPQGDFVVAWARVSPRSSLAKGVFGRLYAADGSPRTGEFRINRSRSDYSDSVHLAMMDDGSFVAVFPVADPQPSRNLLLARRFASDGKPLGDSLVVAHRQAIGGAFAVGSRGDGGFVVTWIDSGISARAFGTDGQPLGPEVQVVSDRLYGPRLTVRPDGSFLVVWVRTEATPSGYNDFVEGRLFNADGIPQGERFLISEDLPRSFFLGFDTVVDSAGNFLVTWLQPVSASVAPSAFVRRYAPDGSPLGPPSPMGHRPAGQEITAGPDGSLVSAWEGRVSPFVDVVVRQFAAGGAPLGPLVVLNASRSQVARLPILAGNGAGSFVAVFYGKPRGADIALLARRFRTD